MGDIQLARLAPNYASWSVLPRSIDRIRLIRRSMRCFIFGAIGLVPILGIGMAIQALRLQRAISADLEEPRKVQRVAGFWLLGLVVLWPVDALSGLSGDMIVVLAILGVQSRVIWRRLVAAPETTWNPARRHVIWGVILAYAGLAISLWAVAILGSRLIKMSASA